MRYRSILVFVALASAQMAWAQDGGVDSGMAISPVTDTPTELRFADVLQDFNRLVNQDFSSREIDLKMMQAMPSGGYGVYSTARARLTFGAVRDPNAAFPGWQLGRAYCLMTVTGTNGVSKTFSCVFTTRAAYDDFPKMRAQISFSVENSNAIASIMMGRPVAVTPLTIRSVEPLDAMVNVGVPAGLVAGGIIVANPLTALPIAGAATVAIGAAALGCYDVQFETSGGLVDRDHQLYVMVRKDSEGCKR